MATAENWYIPINEINDTFTISADTPIEIVRARFKHSSIQGGVLLPTHHLIVYSTTEHPEIVGVVTDEKIMKKTGYLNRISKITGNYNVTSYMVPSEKIPRFKYNAPRLLIRASLRKDEKQWLNYRESRMIFLEDELGKIVGVATDYDLLGE